MSLFCPPVLRALTFALLLLPVANALQAQPLRVAVAEAAYINLPQVRERILPALRDSGLEIELVVLPGNRALQAASRGEVALDIYRQPEAIAGVANLVALEPRVDEVTFGMVTSARDAHNCAASEAQFGQMSVVGRIGIKLYEDYYYPRFAEATTVADFAQMLKVVAMRRADVSFLTEPAFRRFAAEYHEQLVFCQNHRRSFAIHSFIHRDYLWAKPRIEAAYRKAFGDAK